MALDLRDWLTKELGLSTVVVDDLVGPLTPALPKIEEHVLRQSDYSRKMAEVQAKSTEIASQQQKLDEANQRLNQELLDWAEAQKAGEPLTVKMRTDLENAQAEVARLHSRLETLAAQAGIDPATILPPPSKEPVAPPPPAAPDLSGYVRLDQLGGMAQLLITLPAELQAIADEHRELTGERLDTRQIVAEFQKRASSKQQAPDKPADVRAIWEDAHKIAEKRAAKSAAAHEAEMKAAEDRGYERARTEQMTPTAHPAAHGSSVLINAGRTQPQLKAPTAADRVDRISQAASALATHRYRQQGQQGQERKAG
jgi:hypothetical protein